MAFKKLKLWFDKDLCIDLATKIQQIEPSFSRDYFLEQTVPQLDALELKDRVALIGKGLHLSFKSNYSTNIEILLQILGPENKEETGMFKKYYRLMPIASYVEQYGLNDFDCSMKAIEEITKRNTGEYTIRPFIEKFTEQTMHQMRTWSLNDNKHIRRLASEGVRPRLPWAKKLDTFIQNPTPIWPILKNLKDDPSKYVQKSVANCLNDVLKDNPEEAISQIENWKINASPQRRWIIKHALRNLLKKEDPWALSTIAELNKLN